MLKDGAMKTFSAVPGKERSLEVACNLCFSNRYKTVLKSAYFLFVKSSSCGLIYQNPQPLFADHKERYTADYFKYEFNNEENFFRLMKLGLKDICMDRLEPDNGRGRFLDIGCATGKLMEDMRGRGWQVQGVDLSRESAEYGWKKRKVKIFAGTLEQAAFQSGSFNIYSLLSPH
ncbi:MAG: methyltransferase domain-containing protein [Planctomycetes bacterium]|nr:methyltransferase domain-containing protein [Planctomycetota bacterium]